MSFSLLIYAFTASVSQVWFKMAARNLVSVGNLVPYKKRLINKDWHRKTKVSVYISIYKVSSTVFGQSVILLTARLFNFIWYSNPFMLVLPCLTIVCQHVYCSLQYYLCIIVLFRLLCGYYSPLSLFWFITSVYPAISLFSTPKWSNLKKIITAATFFSIGKLSCPWHYYTPSFEMKVKWIKIKNNSQCLPNLRIWQNKRNIKGGTSQDLN